MRQARFFRTCSNRLGRDEAGFTLIELLVATALSIVLLLVIHDFASSAQRSQAATGERSMTLSEQRAALERMTRELRQATTVNASTPGLVDFQVPGAAGGAARRIQYDCRAGYRCRRYEGPATGALTQTDASMVDDVQTATFTAQSLSTSQDYLTIDLRVSLPGRPLTIALTDGVHLRSKGGT